MTYLMLSLVLMHDRDAPLHVKALSWGMKALFVSWPAWLLLLPRN